MSKNTDNGLLWALGAAGALALGSMVVGRGAAPAPSGRGSMSRATDARRTHTCVTCGRGVHLVSGSRDTKEEETEVAVSSRGSSSGRT